MYAIADGPDQAAELAVIADVCARLSMTCEEERRPGHIALHCWTDEAVTAVEPMLFALCGEPEYWTP